MGLYAIEHLNENTLIGIWKIEEDQEKLMSLLTFSEHFEGRWQELTNNKRKIEYLATRVLLKTLYKEEHIIKYNKDGSPILENGVNISISHSKLFVAVIVSKESKVAIDMEEISNIANRIRNRFLTILELSLIQTYQGDVNYMATLLWSAKECLYKIGKSPCKSKYKDQLNIKRIDDDFILGQIGKTEQYKIFYKVIEGFVLTGIVAD